jgi:hypothetical protein
MSFGLSHFSAAPLSDRAELLPFVSHVIEAAIS